MMAWFVIDAAVTSKCQNIAQSELVADLCNADVPMVPDTGARVQHMRRHVFTFQQDYAQDYSEFKL